MGAGLAGIVKNGFRGCGSLLPHPLVFLLELRSQPKLDLTYIEREIAVVDAGHLREGRRVGSEGVDVHSR
jgi:hypothetical protein